VTDCPCAERIVEDQAGNIVWRVEGNQWCGNPAGRITTAGGDVIDFWCDTCISKACDWCHHD
jgi:hypothetical protein